MIPVLVRGLAVIEVDQHVCQVLVQSVLNIRCTSRCRRVIGGLLRLSLLLVVLRLLMAPVMSMTLGRLLLLRCSLLALAAHHSALFLVLCLLLLSLLVLVIVVLGCTGLSMMVVEGALSGTLSTRLLLLCLPMRFLRRRGPRMFILNLIT